MSEETLATPLSGSEVVASILHRVRTMLENDCYLSPNCAYESFEADISVKVKMLDIGRTPEVKVHANVKSIPPMGLSEDDDAALNEAESHMFPAPPNQVRLESNQDIPTLVKGADGEETIKGTKYTEPVKTQIVRGRSASQ